MTPEEECQEFWTKWMQQVHVYLSQLDPPRYLAFLQARPRNRKDTKQQPNDRKRKPRPDH